MRIRARLSPQEAGGFEETEEGREGVGWEWWKARPLHLPQQVLRFLVFLQVSERFKDTRRAFHLYLNNPQVGDIYTL